jgi:subtilisin family serine protease
MRAAFQYASSHGVLNVAAAGNDNRDQLFYPAAFGEFVIAVAGTDQNDARYTSSNYGDWIELSAPAVNIISTLPGNSYDSLTGTSMASAFVTGVAALVWSHFQVLSEDQVRERLQETAVDLGVAGRDPFFGYGRVDAFSALNMPLNPPVGGIVLETQPHVFFVLCAEIIAAAMGSAGTAALLMYYRQHRTGRAKNREL